MDAMEILQKDAREWKKRALAAEAKLSNYRKCLTYADAVGTALVSRGRGDSTKTDEAIAELMIEVGMVQEFDPPRDFWNQRVSLDGTEEETLAIRSVTNLAGCAVLDLENGVIEIKQDQPDEGKVIGLLFQMAQLADIASSAELDLPRVLVPDRLHLFAPVLAVLLEGSGLLNPALGMQVPAIIRFVDEGQKAAASGN